MSCRSTLPYLLTVKPTTAVLDRMPLLGTTLVCYTLPPLEQVLLLSDSNP